MRTDKVIQILIFTCFYYSTLPANSGASPVVLSIDGGEEDDARTLGRSRPRRGYEARYDKTLEDYLTQFGYLPRSGANALRTRDHLVNAVKNLQFFAGLNTTGLVDEATLDLMTSPRCGVPDVSQIGYRNRRQAHHHPLHHTRDHHHRGRRGRVRVRRYNLQGERWPTSNLTWSIRKPAPELDITELRRELAAALEMWARESSLKFTELTEGDEKKADIQVFFYSGPHYDGYPFDGYGTVLAHAFFPGGGRGGDAHFDADEEWTTEERTVSKYRASVFAVAIHEFGHSLGLSHSSIEGSLMYPWYSMEIPSDFRLPIDDRVAIQHLYGPNKDRHNKDKDGLDDAKTTPDSLDGSPTKSTPTSRTKTIFVESNSPDKCDTDFDAVAVIRSEMWAFKGRHFWRIHNRDRGRDQRGEPVELTAFWYGLPANVDKVDAVYERPDHKIVFFAGAYFYVLAGNSQLEQGPTPLSYLGLPDDLDHVDAAMRWGWNGRTYIFSGSKYWRFDEAEGRVELDYPRDISMWRGIPGGIDAAFQYVDGKTYFFKGKYFWQFDDTRMTVADARPKRIGTHWMKCPTSEAAAGNNNNKKRNSLRNPFRNRNNHLQGTRRRQDLSMLTNLDSSASAIILDPFLLSTLSAHCKVALASAASLAVHTLTLSRLRS